MAISSSEDIFDANIERERKRPNFYSVINVHARRRLDLVLK